MPSWIKRLARRMGLTSPEPALRLPPRVALRLARQLQLTEPIEFDCDEVYQLMDRFAEAVQRGDEVADWLPLVRAHLELCPDCREEFEALMQALRVAWA